MAYTSKKTDTVKENASSVLPADNYPAVFVGYFVSKHAPFDEKGEPYDAIRFALQLEDPDGKPKVVQTNDMRVSLSDKSTLFKSVFQTWIPSKDPSDLWEKLIKFGIVIEDENDHKNDQLVFDNLLGKQVLLGATVKISKSDKEYNEFTFNPKRKNQDFKPILEEGKLVPIWKPKFVKEEDEIDATCIDGFEWKRGSKKDENPEEDTDKSQTTPKTSKYKTVSKGTAKEPEVSDTDAPF